MNQPQSLRDGAQTATVPGVPRQFLRFALGASHYAVAIDVVREILQVGALTPVPMMPPDLRGVMNLRGAVVPVIDLSTRLSLGEGRIGRRSCIVVVEVADGDDGPAAPMGVLVDAVSEVFEVPSLEPPPAFGTPVEAHFIDGMARQGQQVLVVLDLNRVLAQDDPAPAATH